MNRRFNYRWWGPGAVAAMGAVISVSAAYALSGSTFESTDGNLVVNSAANKDWANAPGLETATDLPTGTSDNSFKSAKEDDSDPGIDFGSIPNNKSDLQHFYFSSETVGTNLFMYLGWSRANTLGSANIDFEFNQSTALSGNGVTPVRTAGDVLITFDFENGGSRPSLGMLIWLTAGHGDSASSCFASSTLPCWGRRVDLSAAGFADGSVNASGPVADPIFGGTIPLLAFGEAAINLTQALGIGPETCNPFATAYAKSRSSPSFTAAMKDFIAPIDVTFATCGNINIHKQDDLGGALQGAVFQLFTGSPSGTTCTGAAVSPAKTCTTDASGNCSMGSVVFGSYCVAETATPAGHFTAPAQAVTVSGGSATVNLVFSDPRKVRIITFVCLERDSTLYPSAVSLNGGAPISTLRAADLPAGLSEATVCNLAAARFDGLGANASYPLNVTIPLSQ